MQGRCTHAPALLAQSDVRPVLPALSNVLYESIYEAQQWMLFDAHKRRVAVGDAYPSSYNVKDLPKGDYVLRLHLRHEDPVTLGKLTAQTLLLERPLAKVDFRFCKKKIVVND